MLIHYRQRPIPDMLPFIMLNYPPLHPIQWFVKLIILLLILIWVLAC